MNELVEAGQCLVVPATRMTSCCVEYLATMVGGKIVGSGWMCLFKSNVGLSKVVLTSPHNNVGSICGESRSG